MFLQQIFSNLLLETVQTINASKFKLFGLDELPIEEILIDSHLKYHLSREISHSYVCIALHIISE